MPRLIEVCPQCQKNKIEIWRSAETIYLKCGHYCALTEPVELRAEIDFYSKDRTKCAYDFQQSGVEFILRSNLNCLIADAMGLGKTIQALVAIREAAEMSKINKDEKSKISPFPTLIVVPAAVQFNWVRETFSWYLDESIVTDVYPPITGKQMFIPKGFKFYIISRDSLAANLKQLQSVEFKCVVVDECHAFKDISAQRTKALIRLIAGQDITHQHSSDGYRTIKTQENQGIKHRIFLSGTPIKNRADEYFTVLNLLDPVSFPNMASFRRLWLNGSSLKSWQVERFHEKTSKYILRREKTAVLKNLPPFTRNYEWVTITDPEIKNTYNANLHQFRVEMLAGMNSMQILGWLAKMRRLTALAKLEFANEWITNWLEDAELNHMAFDSDYPVKLLVGVHHEDVVNNFKFGLSNYGALSLTGKDSAIDKMNIVDKFTSDSKVKVLVCSMLAGGVGLNIQCAPNILTVERQWSAADEEQFEARSWRDGQKYPVTNTILMAGGTIDQFFHEKVEMKRALCAETLNYTLTSDPEGMKELAWRVIDNPL